MASSGVAITFAVGDPGLHRLPLRARREGRVGLIDADRRERSGAARFESRLEEPASSRI
jgi:hypothetical protein